MDPLSWDEVAMLRDRGLLPAPAGGAFDPAPAGVNVSDRYRGAFVGLAIGDAMGRPVSGLGSVEINQRFGVVNRFLTKPVPNWLLPAGQISDETQLTLTLAASISDRGAFEPADFAKRLMAWLPIARSEGQANRLATVSLRNGAPWVRSGIASAGSGAATRAAAIGLLHPHDLADLRRDAAVSAIITHADGAAIASAVVVAAAVAFLTSTPRGSFSVEEFSSAIDLAMTGVPDPEHALRHVASASTLAERIRLALRTGGSTPSEAAGVLQTGGFVFESLPMAIWCFVTHAEDPAGAIMTAVNIGGATDTIAAITGAMAGAYHGASALPAVWVDHVEYLDGIAAYADDLFELNGFGRREPPVGNPDPLSPATHAPFRLGGSVMPTIEHAIRASSADDPASALRIRLTPTPADARRMAQTTKLRSNWPVNAPLTVASILRRRFDGEGLDELVGADGSGLSRFGEAFRAEPFDYVGLLSQLRRELAGAPV